MSETIISQSVTAAAKAEADLKETLSYVADAKAAVKDAKTNLKAVNAAVKVYAPRVVAGVKWLNKNARGWTTGLVSETDLGFTIRRIPSDDELQALGFEADPRADKRLSVDSEDVLTALWQTAQEIQQGKKSVTVERLLKRSGLS